MLRDITGTILIPGNHGRDCPGNGEHPGVECCCDECDFLMCCTEETDCEGCAFVGNGLCAVPREGG